MRPSFVWLLPVLLIGLLLVAQAAHAQPQTTAFTYQGSLELNGGAFSGSANFEFRLWDDSVAGTQVAPAVTRNGVNVSNGVFTVELDFGAVFGTQQRWLQIVVNGQVLSPRQPVTPTPMAIYALSGLPGPQGVAGPIGPSGIQGPPGEQGPPGLGDMAYGGTAHSSPLLATGATASYASVLGSSEVRPGEARAAAVVPSNCTMRDLRVRFSSGTNSYLSTTATLMRNGMPTALTCGIALPGAGTAGCTDVANAASLTAGDLISLRFEPAFPRVPLTNVDGAHLVFANFGLRCVAGP